MAATSDCEDAAEALPPPHSGGMGGDRRAAGALRPDSATFLLRADHVAERLLDGELVLYDPRRQRVHVLNPTAAVAWRLCDGAHTLDGIVAALAERYPRSRRAIEADVPEILRMFRTEGLLRA